MIDDSDDAVAAAAAARALGVTSDGSPAARLRGLLVHAQERVRRTAVEQLALAPRAWQARLAFEMLTDPVPSVRAAALDLFGPAAPDRALEVALDRLEDPDAAVRMAAGRALGSAGAGAIEHVLKALEDPRTEPAGIEAVRTIGTCGGGDRVRAFVRSSALRATRERELATIIPAEDEVSRLLRDAVVGRGQRIARSGLWAATTLGSRRDAMETAIENLDGSSAQVAAGSAISSLTRPKKRLENRTK